MHDNAPGHTGRVTQEELIERGIRLIFWPPFSPDLNPIETVWNWMKDYIEAKYGVDLDISYDKLREMVKEAWDSISHERVCELLQTMRQRCQDIIDADGGYN